MKFGIFDHVDTNGLPLSELLDKRIEYVKAVEEAGFYSYHVAEHHATPLNLVPVPGVYLGAVANATTTLRLGPLCYLLPLYSPLRLIEEIGILDHLCHGRLDIGVGRGVSPFELNYHKVDPETSREVFLEALDAVINGLTHDHLTHEGRHFNYKDVPMEVQSCQKPFPPIWYPTSSPESAAYVGKGGYHFVTLGAMESAKACIAAYKENFAADGPHHIASDDFEGGTAIGVSRHVIVGKDHEDAMRIARPAYRKWHDSLTKLWRENDVQGPSFSRLMVDDVELAMEAGSDIVGDANSVGDQIAKQVEELGINYMICQFYFGDMAHEDAMASLARFRESVMPAFQ